MLFSLKASISNSRYVLCALFLCFPLLSFVFESFIFGFGNQLQTVENTIYLLMENIFHSSLNVSLHYTLPYTTLGLFCLFCHINRNLANSQNCSNQETSALFLHSATLNSYFIFTYVVE
jgi:hypothetical protein